jgi:GNAT superfamily N-acetyltransferase
MKSYRFLILLAAIFLCTSGAYGESAVPVPIFEFHSGFWINLHHFLFKLAQPISAEPSIAEDLKVKAGPEWDAAVLYYKQKMISRDLLFDNGMSEIKLALEDQENEKTLKPGGQLTQELVSVIEKAAPAYRERWWKAHDAANHQWTEAVSVLLNKYGETLVHELSDAYKTPWPDYTIRVDVTNYASWSGAYTTIDPTRITISAGDRANNGTAALEIVFHEASHGIAAKLMNAIAEECAKQKVMLPRRDLWHAVLFYTTGEIVRHHFPGYIPYGYNGLWDRAWPMYIKSFEQDWLPYVNGKVSFEAAVTTLVHDVGRPAK